MNKNQNLPEFLMSENLKNEGQFFGYEGKILTMPKQVIDNYKEGVENDSSFNLPFVYDITFDLKEHMFNQDKTIIQALDQLEYVGAQKIEDEKFLKDFQESIFAKNKNSLDKFHTYLSGEHNNSDIGTMTMSDESNNLFYNGLGQGFKPSNLRNLDKKKMPSLDDVFQYQQF